MKKLGGIFVDDRYFYTWGPGYVLEGDSYPKDTVYIYDKKRAFAFDGMLVGHGQDITCVASDPTRIFVGGGGGKDLTGYRYSVLCTYDKTTQLLQDDEGGDEYRAVSLLYDGTHLFMGTDDGLIIVHKWGPALEYFTLWPEKTRTCAEVLFADEAYLYSAGNNGSLISWEKDKFVYKGEWLGHANQISRIIGSKINLISGDSGGEIIIWDAKSGNQLTRWKAHTGRINGLTLQGSHLFSCGQDQLIKIWNVDNHKELSALQHHPAPVIALEIDDSFLYAGYADGVIDAWEISKVIEQVGRT